MPLAKPRRRSTSCCFDRRIADRPRRPNEIEVTEANPKRIARILDNLAKRSNTEFQDKALRVLLRRTRFTGHSGWVNVVIMPWRPDASRRRLVAGAVAVALEQPALVEVFGERADACAELVEGVEAFDPEHLLLERLVELLDAAVGLGLVVVGRAATDAEMIDLGLIVRRAEARAAVVAQRQAGRDGPLNGAEAFGADLSEQVGDGPAVHPREASTQTSPLA